VAKVPDISGCYTQGKTVEQAMERIKEAIQVCVEADDEEIMPLKFRSTAVRGHCMTRLLPTGI